MSFIKKVNKEFKKRFLNLFMVNVVFAAVYLLFLILVRGRIESNLGKLRVLAPGLQNLAPLLEESPEALVQAEGAINQVTSLGNQTMFLLWAIPIGTIVLWCIFQGVSWALMTEKVKKNLRIFFMRFSVVSAVALILLFTVGYYTISEMTSVFQIEISGFLTYLGFSFLIFYYLFVFYGFAIRNRGLKDTVKRAFKISFREAPKLVPLFIPMFILLTALIFTFFNIYTNKIVGTFDLVTVLPWTLFLLGLLAVAIWYKIFLNVYLERH